MTPCLPLFFPLTYQIRLGIDGASRENGETKVTNANRPAAHIRRHGLMIDASFRKDGTVEYYVVEKGHGRFYSLDVAKEIAEHRAAHKAA